MVIGREVELARVDAAIGAGHAVLVEGEPGVGKTTIFQAAVERARGRQLLARPVEPEASLPYATLGDLIGEVLPEVRDRLPPPRARALEVSLLLAEPAAAPPDARAIGLGLVSLLDALDPVVIAIDDAQWVDPASAEVLAFALRRARSAALAAARPGESRVDLEWDERIGLTGLSVGALHRLVHDSVGAVLSRPLLLRVHEASGGNPLYAIELARALAVDPPARAAEPLPVTPTLDELVRSRLDVLDPPVRSSLQLLAASAERRAGLVDPGHVDAAVAAGVLERQGDAVRFTHPLLATAALADADAPAIHAQLARLVQDEEQRTRHRALAADGPDDTVAEALDGATASAARRGAPSAAAELAELAAGLSTGLARDRRLVAAAAHHQTAGDLARAHELRAPLVERLPPGPERGRVLVQLAHPNDDLDAGQELCRRALAEAGDDAAVVAAAETALHELAILRGATDEALAHARAAVAAAERAGDDVLLARCLADAALVETWVGEITPGLLERAVEMERSLEGVPLYYGPTVIAAIRAKYEARWHESQTLFEDALTRIDAAGDDAARIVALLHLADLRWRVGDAAAAVEIASDGLTLAELSGDPQWQSALLSVLERSQATLGALADARAEANRGIECAQRAGGGIFRLQNLGVLGLIALVEGDTARAAAILSEVAPQLDDDATRAPGVLTALPDAAEALALVGETEHAWSIVNELERAGERNPAAAAAAGRGRSLLEGTPAAALAAAELQGELGQRVERGRSLLVAGTILRRGKQKAAARTALEEAVELFAGASASRWEARARAELGRIGGRTRADGLTPTEERVARLVAEGRSNKEVAAALFVTVRTVESNLTRVYEKLGVRSRTELAAKLR